jgi:hypothetical protein
MVAIDECFFKVPYSQFSGLDWSNNGMTGNLFARRLLRHSIVVLLFSIIFSLQLSAQNSGLQDELNHSLYGTTVISTVIIGEKATPPGKSGCPVDTVVYPGNNEVAYRIDLGGTSTAITAREMLYSFDRGTSFEVSSIELQDGWLDLNLKSVSGGNARLRFMLGHGWQSRLDSASIQAQLARVLILDQNPLPEKQRQTALPVGVEVTFVQKKHDSPSKGSRQETKPAAIILGTFGSTS